LKLLFRQRAEAERLWKEEQERLAAQKRKHELEFRHRNQQLNDSMLKFQSNYTILREMFLLCSTLLLVFVSGLKNEVDAQKSLDKSEAEARLAIFNIFSLTWLVHLYGCL
jgi:hypothetical protein